MTHSSSSTEQEQDLSGARLQSGGPQVLKGSRQISSCLRGENCGRNPSNRYFPATLFTAASADPGLAALTLLKASVFKTQSVEFKRPRGQSFRTGCPDKPPPPLTQVSAGGGGGQKLPDPDDGLRGSVSRSSGCHHGTWPSIRAQSPG